MTKQTTVRLPDELADDAEAVGRVRGDRVNQLIIDSLADEIERVRADDVFTARAKKLLERDREILDRLAERPATSASPSSGSSPGTSPESTPRR